MQQNMGAGVGATEEVLYIVDEDDREVGSILRSHAHLLGAGLTVRCVNAFLAHSGRIWVPLRQSWKRQFPSTLDFSVGGHVEWGESYLKAFLREAEEEIGLVLGSGDYREVAALRGGHDGVRVNQRVYLIPFENDCPAFNTDDYESWTWMTSAELLELHRSRPGSLKPDLAAVVANPVVSAAIASL